MPRRWAPVILAAGIALAALAAACGGGEDSDEQAVDELPVAQSAVEQVADEQASTTPAEPAPPPPADQLEPEVPPPPEISAEEQGDWVRISPSGDFERIAVDESGRIIIAAGRGAGIISRDGGATWELLDWPGDQRFGVAVSPDGLQILVSGIGALAGQENTSLWSTDGGLTWTDTGRLVQTAVAQVTDLFLVGSAGTGLISTSDGGATGPILIRQGVDGDGNFAPVNITLNARRIDDIVLISASEGGSVLLTRTRDRGETIELLETGFELSGATVVSFFPVGFVLMSQGSGVLLSFDDGATWFSQNVGLEKFDQSGAYPALVDLVVMPGSALPILASTTLSLRFDPGGWEAIGRPGSQIRDLVVLPGAPPAVLAATADGVYRLEDPAAAIVTPGP